MINVILEQKDEQGIDANVIGVGANMLSNRKRSASQNAKSKVPKVNGLLY